MSDIADPSLHRLREQRLIQHVEKLLTDDRMRLDTILGSRPITSTVRDVAKSDRSLDVKRMLMEMGLPDRQLQNAMPVGLTLDVTLSRIHWWVLKQTLGQLLVVCLSPTRALVTRQEPEPMNVSELQRALAAIAPAPRGVPQTLVLLSTSGFTPEAHELAERRAKRTVVLVEPNAVGGWTVTGPPEAQALASLFDPEADDDKKSRVREVIEQSELELLTSGLASDKLAARTQLPAPMIESELKAFARANPGMVAKRLDGRLVLFRESSAPSAAAAGVGGAAMTFVDKMKSLFARKGDNEKKIAFLSERRTALAQQRDRSYEDMGALEGQEQELRDQFKAAGGSITKRRITSQLLQLRKDIERRQQLLGVLNQQINIVSTHLHNLELVQQGQTAKLPDSEEMTADAVKAEEMLAELEANTELAGSVTISGSAGLTSEEQALYEELEREAGAEKTAEPEASQPNAPAIPAPRVSDPPQRSAVTPPPLAQPQRRGRAEPG